MTHFLRLFKITSYVNMIYGMFVGWGRAFFYVFILPKIFSRQIHSFLSFCRRKSPIANELGTKKLCFILLECLRIFKALK